MFSNLTIAEWLGPTRHPPRSLIRPILVLIDLRGLRPFVLHHFRTEAMESSTRDRVSRFFFVIDETCFFTYAQYVEPFTSSAVIINDLRHALVHRILQTWGIHFRSAMLHIQITDRHGQNHALQVNILSSRSWAPIILCGFVVVISMAIFPSQFYLVAHVYYALLVHALPSTFLPLTDLGLKQCFFYSVHHFDQFALVFALDHAVWFPNVHSHSRSLAMTKRDSNFAELPSPRQLRMESFDVEMPMVVANSYTTTNPSTHNPTSHPHALLQCCPSQPS